MSPDLSSEKAVLRQALRAKLASVSESDRAAASILAGERLVKQYAWYRASHVLLYAPLRDELNLWPLAELVLTSDNNLMLPGFDPAQGIYMLRRVTDLANDLAPGKFGILEPKPHCPIVPINQLDLALVPGVAFDTYGRRLGRGKGFYDQLLTGFTGIKCGVGYDFQVVERIPAEPHDVVLDCILTPSRWLEVPPRAVEE